MSDATKKYIDKLCNVALNNDYNVTHETDDNIVSYYWILKFIPIYFEIITGCYDIYDINKRYEYANLLNEYVKNLAGYNYNFLQLNVNQQANFSAYQSLFIDWHKVHKDSYNEFTTHVQKISDEIKKIAQYKQIIKEPIANKLTKIIPLIELSDSSDTYTSIDSVDTIYNTKKPNYKKEHLIKEALRRNIIGSTKMTVAMLEDALIKDLAGETLKDKLKELNIDNTKKTITEKGYRTVILEKITSTLDNNISPQTNNIPKTIRAMVWNTYIGEEKGTGNCFICGSKIDSKHFECGHVIAKSKGGENSIDNLRCICSLCNKSVGSINMNDFKKTYSLNK
jgi:hypothetical protein